MDAHMKNPPTYPLRLVRWVDARGTSPNWMPVAEATEGVCEIRSVGYVISDDGECVVVAPHMTEEGERDTVGVMYIPRMAIREVMALQVSEDGFPFTRDQLNRGGGTTVRMDFVEGGEPTSEDADLRGELEAAKATAEAEARASTRARRHRDEAWAETERMREELEAAKASEDSLMGQLNLAQGYIVDLMKERDAARDEVERLRAGIEDTVGDLRKIFGERSVTMDRLHALLEGGGE